MKYIWIFTFMGIALYSEDFSSNSILEQKDILSQSITKNEEESILLKYNDAKSLLEQNSSSWSNTVQDNAILESLFSLQNSEEFNDSVLFYEKDSLNTNEFEKIWEWIERDYQQANSYLEEIDQRIKEYDLSLDELKSNFKESLLSQYQEFINILSVPWLHINSDPSSPLNEVGLNLKSNLDSWKSAIMNEDGLSNANAFIMNLLTEYKNYNQSKANEFINQIYFDNLWKSSEIQNDLNIKENDIFFKNVSNYLHSIPNNLINYISESTGYQNISIISAELEGYTNDSTIDNQKTIYFLHDPNQVTTGRNGKYSTEGNDYDSYTFNALACWIGVVKFCLPYPLVFPESTIKISVNFKGTNQSNLNNYNYFTRNASDFNAQLQYFQNSVAKPTEEFEEEILRLKNLINQYRNIHSEEKAKIETNYSNNKDKFFFQDNLSDLSLNESSISTISQKFRDWGNFETSFNQLQSSANQIIKTNQQTWNGLYQYTFYQTNEILSNEIYHQASKERFQTYNEKREFHSTVDSSIISWYTNNCVSNHSSNPECESIYNNDAYTHKKYSSVKENPDGSITLVEKVATGGIKLKKGGNLWDSNDYEIEYIDKVITLASLQAVEYASNDKRLFERWDNEDYKNIQDNQNKNSDRFYKNLNTIYQNDFDELQRISNTSEFLLKESNRNLKINSEFKNMFQSIVETYLSGGTINTWIQNTLESRIQNLFVVELSKYHPEWDLNLLATVVGEWRSRTIRNQANEFADQRIKLITSAFHFPANLILPNLTKSVYPIISNILSESLVGVDIALKKLNFNGLGNKLESSKEFIKFKDLSSERNHGNLKMQFESEVESQKMKILALQLSDSVPGLNSSDALNLLNQWDSDRVEKETKKQNREQAIQVGANIAASVLISSIPGMQITGTSILAKTLSSLGNTFNAIKNFIPGGSYWNIIPQSLASNQNLLIQEGAMFGKLLLQTGYNSYKGDLEKAGLSVLNSALLGSTGNFGLSGQFTYNTPQSTGSILENFESKGGGKLGVELGINKNFSNGVGISGGISFVPGVGTNLNFLIKPQGSSLGSGKLSYNLDTNSYRYGVQSQNSIGNTSIQLDEKNQMILGSQLAIPALGSSNSLAIEFTDSHRFQLGFNTLNTRAASMSYHDIHKSYGAIKINNQFMEDSADVLYDYLKNNHNYSYDNVSSERMKKKIDELVQEQNLTPSSNDKNKQLVDHEVYKEILKISDKLDISTISKNNHIKNISLEYIDLMESIKTQLPESVLDLQSNKILKTFDDMKLESFSKNFMEKISGNKDLIRDFKEEMKQNSKKYFENPSIQKIQKYSDEKIDIALNELFKTFDSVEESIKTEEGLIDYTTKLFQNNRQDSDMKIQMTLFSALMSKLSNNDKKYLDTIVTTAPKNVSIQRFKGLDLDNYTKDEKGRFILSKVHYENAKESFGYFLNGKPNQFTGITPKDIENGVGVGSGICKIFSEHRSSILNQFNTECFANFYAKKIFLGDVKISSTPSGKGPVLDQNTLNMTTRFAPEHLDERLLWNFNQYNLSGILNLVKTVEPGKAFVLAVNSDPTQNQSRHHILGVRLKDGRVLVWDQNSSNGKSSLPYETLNTNSNPGLWEKYSKNTGIFRIYK